MKDEKAEETLLDLYVNYYNSFKWPTEAHRLSCTTMFSILANRAGLSNTIRTIYRDGQMPETSQRFHMWKECIKLKKSSLAVQQEKLDQINRKIKDEKQQNHPFTFRKAPPSFLVDPDTNFQKEWKLEDHVEGVEWDIQFDRHELWELAERKRTLRKMQQMGPMDDDSYCDHVASNDVCQ